MAYRLRRVSMMVILLYPQYSKLTSSSVSLSLQEKVGLFQSLFKGREDVLLKDGIVKRLRSLAISLYVNVMEQGFCDKRKYKCSECPNRKFAPLSYEHIFNHLAGKKDNYGRDVVGLYPMLNDNTCYFLCTDF